jgi:hypothetical protein
MSKKGLARMEYKHSDFNGYIEKLSSAINSISARYEGKVGMDNPDPFEFEKVTMKEMQQGNLVPALREVFSIMGFPHKILPGSDYKAVEEAIQHSGKKLKPKTSSLFRGRYVVDAI